LEGEEGREGREQEGREQEGKEGKGNNTLIYLSFRYKPYNPIIRYLLNFFYRLIYLYIIDVSSKQQTRELTE
tara:strand:- start:6 stop:221 length:216 start_codon:yes stop_codon:yes gene_type:complete